MAQDGNHPLFFSLADLCHNDQDGVFDRCVLTMLGKGGKASSYEEFIVGSKLNDALNGVDREGSWNGVDHDHDAGQVYSQV